MNRFSYTLLLYLLTPIVWIYFVYRGFKDAEYWKNWSERLGYIPRKIFENRSKNSQCLHIHCASLGESRAAFPLIKSLIQKYPEAVVLITTTTPTGRSEVIKLIGDLETKSRELKIDVCYLPTDWPGACGRFLDRINPSISILMETELWPNFIHQVRNRDIPILLANARMSNSSLKKYLKYPRLSIPMFASLNFTAAQYESDKDKFLLLGCKEDQISTVGNVKFDINISERLKQEQQELKKLWSADRPCWIAASIHFAEFDAILDAHQYLLAKIPNLLLIAVPRHPERFSELKNNCSKRNLSFVSRSEQNKPTQTHSIVIGDTMGELMLMFGVADIAFMGGSLIARGGHNPIEPAACGIPVIMGTSDYNFVDVCKIMERSGALVRVENSQQLAEAVESLLLEKVTLEKKSKASIRLIQENKGSVDRLIAIIEKMNG